MRLWPDSARWRWSGCSRGRSRAEREWVAVTIDGCGLLVCHDSTVNGDRHFTVLKGLTPCGVDLDDGLTCSSKRLQRTVTQNRHFNEQAESLTREGVHPDSCPRWRRSLSGPSCPHRGEYAGASGWVLWSGRRCRGSDRLARSANRVMRARPSSERATASAGTRARLQTSADESLFPGCRQVEGFVGAAGVSARRPASSGGSSRS